MEQKVGRNVAHHYGDDNPGKDARCVDGKLTGFGRVVDFYVLSNLGLKGLRLGHCLAFPFRCALLSLLILLPVEGLSTPPPNLLTSS